MPRIKITYCEATPIHKSSECVDCKRIYNRQYRKHNHEKLLELKREYYLKNAERIKEGARSRRSERAKYMRKRRRTNEGFRIAGELRKKVRSYLTRRTFANESIVGCNIDYLMAHFESQFSSGMNWDNMSEWEIDHIRPLSSFDLMDPSQRQAASHFSNLRPLWTDVNRRKASKWK